METKPISPIWIVRLVFASVLIGLLVSGIIAAVGQYLFYLVILFPLLMGGTAAITAVIWGMRLNIQNRLVLMILGALFGLLIYASYRYIDYLLFANRLTTTTITFEQYLSLTAKLGVSLAPFRSSGDEIQLNEQMTWLYWIIEILLVCGTGAFAAVRARSRLARRLSA